MTEQFDLVVIGGEDPAHTPTPWRQSDEVENHGTHWEHRIIGQGGGTVARVTSQGVHGPDRKAEMYRNAELIVRGCNLHAQLIEALEVMTEHAGETYPHFESERGQRDIKQAQAVLAQAREVTRG